MNDDELIEKVANLDVAEYGGKVGFKLAENIFRLVQSNHDGWIDVNNALPDSGDYVLTYSDTEGYRLISAGSININGSGLPFTATSWMSLSPPQVKSLCPKCSHPLDGNYCWKCVAMTGEKI